MAWWNSVSSTWGRGFVSSADAAAGRTALGLGNAATATVQTSAFDITAGALMSVGAFGLGSRALSISPNLNNELCSSFLRVEPSTLNRPLEVNYGHAVVCANNAEAAQSVMDIVTGDLWTRKLQAGVGWSNWRKHFHTGNILGTVSQSAGVPTGAIIERGSNANGEYVRFADGTQICSGRLSEGLGSATEHGSSLYYYLKPLTWPASFSDIPTLSGYGVDNTNMGTTSGYALDLYSGQLVYITPTANVINTDIGWTAIGRWY